MHKVETAAAAAKCRSLWTHAVELVMLALAALLALFTWHVTKADLNGWTAVATLAFVVALALAAYRQRTDQHEQWVRGRGVVESIKSAAWRYAVAARPYEDGAADLDSALLDQLQRSVDVVSSLDLPPGSTTGEITEWMRQTRALPYAQRQDVYASGRIDDQIEFYQRRGCEHDTSRRRWGGVSLLANGAGVALGTARFLGALEVDLLGLAATVSGAASAWTQVNQHRATSATYKLTARQLSIARQRLPGVVEDEWPEYVESVEELLGHEHVVWLAHRGSPPVRGPAREPG